MVPDGTATLSRTMVAQSVLEALADAAPSLPEKVQADPLELLLRLYGGRAAFGVTAGAAGRARTEALPAKMARARAES